MIIEWFWFPSFDRFRLRVEIWPFISYLVSWVCCLIVLAYSYIQNTEFIVDCCLWSSQISTRRRESLKGLHQPKWIHRAVIWSWQFYVNEFWKVMHLACIFLDLGIFSSPSWPQIYFTVIFGSIPGEIATQYWSWHKKTISADFS